MKKFYSLSFFLFCLLLTTVYQRAQAQCVGGSSPAAIMMDTTIYFEAGATSIQVNFPKFDPETGMLRCVKLTANMTGVVDTFAITNSTTTSQNVSLTYDRQDEMSGPGLRTPLGNHFRKKYSSSVPSGSAYTISRDTLFRSEMTRTLNDSIEISAFYGKDSVTFDYTIDVLVAPSIPGGTSSMSIATSAFVNFKFEYCACSKVTLPVGLNNFTVSKTGAQAASLSWEGQNDDYQYVYDIEVSRDGRQFSTVETINRKYTAFPSYLYSFTPTNNESGKYYIRVRQRWQNGYVRFTPVKVVEFTNPVFASVSLYPNPSNGNAGIKFVNGKGGQVLVQITSATGQRVLSKEMQVVATDYKSIGSLPAGLYWVKIIDVATKASCVKQLIVR